jgi:hypothetical protein
MKKSLKAAGAACLAAGLISTWDAPASAQSFSESFTGAITPSENLYDVYFILAAGPCSPAYNELVANFIPANTTTTFNITINSIYSFDGVTPNVGNYFTVMGLYDTVTGGVSLGFNPTVGASILSENPAPDYDNGGWTYGYNTTPTESAVASMLESGTYTDQPPYSGGSLNDSSDGGLVDPNAGTYYYWPSPSTGGSYYSTISTDPNNPSDFTLVDFSGASSGGSGYAVEVVPEPTTVSLLALSLLSCGWLRRRRAS